MRIGKAAAIFRQMGRIWNTSSIDQSIKMQLYNTIVLPTALYASETWKKTAVISKRLDVFHQRCLRKISYLDRQWECSQHGPESSASGYCHWKEDATSRTYPSSSDPPYSHDRAYVDSSRWQKGAWQAQVYVAPHIQRRFNIREAAVAQCRKIGGKQRPVENYVCPMRKPAREGLSTK